jgi:tetratricopeptide (TPR) repeat protein
MNPSIESQDSLFVELDDHDLSRQQALANQALLRKAQGDLEGALRLYRQAESVSRQSDDAAVLSAALGHQAVILQTQGDLQGALRLLQEKEAICRRLNDPNGLARALSTQASLLAFKQGQPATGLALAEEALRIATEHGHLVLARQIEPIVNEIRGLLP